ncbi:MAG: VOC family protein [Bdellovibrionaceae bacterium]|nr:VOC family protein [Pseudobdellovibrionaceae bacterium]
MELKITRVAAIRLLTSDLQKSRDFYRALFNHDPVEDSETFVSFRLGESHFDIAVADAKNPVSQGGSVGYWLVDDLGVLLKRASELGATIYRGPLPVPQIQRTIVQIQDPCGGIVGFEAPI